MAASSDIGADIDELFQRPLSEFTAARNALAITLNAAGRVEDAAALRALPKPPLVAWTVNQLYWRHRKRFEQLMKAGARLRATQASQLAGNGGDMRAPSEVLRAAMAELTARAGALLHRAGHAPTPAKTRRITTTLEALATRGSESPAPPAGRLTGDLERPGFNALAALVPRKGGRARGTGSSRVLPFHQRTEQRQPKKLGAAERNRQRENERKAQRSAAAAALRDAERALRKARQAAAHAESALRKAAAAAKITERRKAALDKRAEKAAADADAARQGAHRVASAAEEAAQAVSDAEHQIQTLRSKLESQI